MTTNAENAPGVIRIASKGGKAHYENPSQEGGDAATLCGQGASRITPTLDAADCARCVKAWEKLVTVVQRELLAMFPDKARPLSGPTVTITGTHVHREGVPCGRAYEGDTVHGVDTDAPADCPLCLSQPQELIAGDGTVITVGSRVVVAGHATTDGREHVGTVERLADVYEGVWLVSVMVRHEDDGKPWGYDPMALVTEVLAEWERELLAMSPDKVAGDTAVGIDEMYEAVDAAVEAEIAATVRVPGSDAQRRALRLLVESEPSGATPQVHGATMRSLQAGGWLTYHKASRTVTLAQVARDWVASEHVGGEDVSPTVGLSGYAVSVAKHLVRACGYDMTAALAAVRVHADKVDMGERLGSYVDYVAWQISDADNAPASAPCPAGGRATARESVMADGTVVHRGQCACPVAWGTGYHYTMADALAVAVGHGHVARPLYVAPAEETGGETVMTADGPRVYGRCECESFVCGYQGGHKMLACQETAVDTYFVDLCTGCLVTVGKPITPECTAAFEAWQAAEFERFRAEDAALNAAEREIVDADTVAVRAMMTGDDTDVDAAVSALVEMLPQPRGRELADGPVTIVEGSTAPGFKIDFGPKITDSAETLAAVDRITARDVSALMSPEEAVATLHHRARAWGRRVKASKPRGGRRGARR